MRTNENKTIHSILKQFSSATNINYKILHKEKALKDKKVDAVINLTYGHASFKFALQYINYLDSKSLDAVIFYLRQLPEEGILCARYINKKIALRLIEQNICFMELAGNAYINKPPILVNIQGKKIQESAVTKSSTMFAVAGLKVIFILLCDENNINFPTRKFAELAGVSHSMVSRVIISMLEQGFLTKKNKNTYVLIEKNKLLAQWVIYYHNKLRPKLLHKTYTTNDADWKKNIKLTKGNSYWSGEVAAEQLTNYLRPATGTIYTLDKPNIFAVKNKLKESQAGEIEILNAFWNKDLLKDDSNMVPTILVYADLLAQRNARSHEVAKIIFEKKLSEYHK